MNTDQSHLNVFQTEVTPSHAPTYLALRRTVGWIGILLPFVLMIGNAAIFHGDPTPHSISRFYYTDMRDVFVGGMCAMGLFLFYYSGFDWREDWVGNIAGFFAFVVAFFPTTEYGEPHLSGWLHSISAACLFLALACYSLFLFPRHHRNRPKPDLLRVAIHRTSGVVIIGCVIAVVAHALFGDCEKSRCAFVLFSEIIALEMFGLSWLIAGRTLAIATQPPTRSGHEAPTE